MTVPFFWKVSLKGYGLFEKVHNRLELKWVLIRYRHT